MEHNHCGLSISVDMPYCNYADFQLSSAVWKGPKCCLDDTPYSSKSQGFRGSAECNFQRQAGTRDERDKRSGGCNERLYRWHAAVPSSVPVLCTGDEWLWVVSSLPGLGTPELLSPRAARSFLGSLLCFGGAGRTAHQAAAGLPMMAWHMKVNQKQGCWQRGLCGSGLSLTSLM